MFRRIVCVLLIVLGLFVVPAASAQYGDSAGAGEEATSSEEPWRPKENFWWLFASYAVIWIAMLGYVGKMAGKQQELERELRRLESDQVH